MIMLNSLYFSNSALPIFLNHAKTTLRWLEDVLSNSELNEQFILAQHIYYGARVESDGVKFEFKEIADPTYTLTA